MVRKRDNGSSRINELEIPIGESSGMWGMLLAMRLKYRIFIYVSC